MSWESCGCWAWNYSKISRCLSNPIGLTVVGVAIIAALLGSFDLDKIASKSGEMIGSLIRGLIQMLPKLAGVL